MVQTIKEYAFLTSEYPLILFIENHCNLAQQTVIAREFKAQFGDKLVMELPEGSFPSPEQLKYHVIVKQKMSSKPELTDIDLYVRFGTGKVNPPSFFVCFLSNPSLPFSGILSLLGSHPTSAGTGR